MPTPRHQTRPVSSADRPYSGAEVLLARFFAFASALFVALSTVIEVITWFTKADYQYLGWTILPAVIGLLCAAGLSNDQDNKALQSEPVTRPASDLRTRQIHFHGPFLGSSGNSGGTKTAAAPVVANWQDAERSAALWMRTNGHPDARLTPAGPDGGVDVVASRALAQVKFTGSPVGPRFVEQLAGTALRAQYRGRTALFFSAAGYTAPALRAGQELGVQLYQLRGARQWTRVI